MSGELTRRQRAIALWDSRVGAVGLAMGLLPHFLHHAGFLVGTALIAGATGKALFGLLGLLASIPMLLRLHKRFGTWKAPVVGLVIFITMYSLSTFVVGPMMRGN